MGGGGLVILCAVLSCIKYPNGWIIGYIMHYNSLFFFVLGSVIATHRFNWVNKEYNRREIGVAFIVMLVITEVISFVPHEWEPVLMVLRIPKFPLINKRLSNSWLESNISYSVPLSKPSWLARILVPICTLSVKLPRILESWAEMAEEATAFNSLDL